MSQRIFVGVTTVLVFCFFLLGMFWQGMHGQYREDIFHTSQKFSYPFASAALYERANKTVQQIERTGAISAISAHHLLIADKIAQLFASLGTGREKIIVILSPNHFSLGRSSMQSTDGIWETSLGDIEVDVKALAKIQAIDSDLSFEPETFEHEHGISAITPFVKRWFPQARIVPIVIHEKATSKEIKQLAFAIQQSVPKAIVVASIDMSHQQPQEIQLLHDEATMKAIQDGECQGDCALDVDANRVLETLFEINRLRGTQAWTLTHHGSSMMMGATSDWRENTSHVLGYFQKEREVNVLDQVIRVFMLIWRKE